MKNHGMMDDGLQGLDEEYDCSSSSKRCDEFLKTACNLLYKGMMQKLQRGIDTL